MRAQENEGQGKRKKEKERETEREKMNRTIKKIMVCKSFYAHSANEDESHLGLIRFYGFCYLSQKAEMLEKCAMFLWQQNVRCVYFRPKFHSAPVVSIPFGYMA